MRNNRLIDNISGMPGKRCPVCGRVLPLSHFYQSRTARDGRQSYCKGCQRRYKEKHPSKEYKQNHGDKSLSLW